jgi:hypothetical protein
MIDAVGIIGPVFMASAIRSPQENHVERKEHLCDFCRKSGMPHSDCFISENEIGGINQNTGEIICKYCLNLAMKLGTQK